MWELYCEWLLRFLRSILVLRLTISLPLADAFAISSSSSLSPSPSPSRQSQALLLPNSLHRARPLGIGTRSREEDAFPPRVDHDDDELVEWVTARGGLCEGVEVSAATTSGGSRGLLARRDAPCGEVLVSVPLTACLVTADDGDDGSAAAAPPWSRPLPNKVQLALQVLRHLETSAEGEEGDSSSSSFGNFLSTWPAAEESLPENTLPDELRREAQCDALIEETQNHRAWVIEQYQAVQNLAPADFVPLLSLDAFTRALQLAGSRSIRLPPSGDSNGTSVLVPLVDMANHQAYPTATYRLSNVDDDNQKLAIQLVAARQIVAGDEITISYGAYPNRLMAGCYGFVPVGNPHDFEKVSLLEILQAAAEAGALSAPSSATEMTGVLERMVASAAALGLEVAHHRLTAAGADGELWLALRAATADAGAYAELSEILEAIDDDEADEEDLWESEPEGDVARRAEMIRAACGVLEGRISRRTSRREDEDLLLRQQGQRQEGMDHPRLSAGSRLLVELRLERKRLLSSAAQAMAEVREHPSQVRDLLSSF